MQPDIESHSAEPLFIDKNNMTEVLTGKRSYSPTIENEQIQKRFKSGNRMFRYTVSIETIYKISSEFFL